MSALQTAEQTLNRIARSGAVNVAVPTPQRVLHAKGAARVEKIYHSVEVTRDGKPEVEAVATSRVRMSDGAFDRAISRGQLHPDPRRNMILAAAGRRYRAIWTQAGLEPLQGMDPSKIRTTRESAGLLGTERKCEAFKEYIAASDAIERRARVVVDAIVLHDRAMLDVGRQVALQNDAKLCTAIAMHKLRSGLTDLAVHFGSLTEDEDIPAERRLLPEELSL